MIRLSGARGLVVGGALDVARIVPLVDRAI